MSRAASEIIKMLKNRQVQSDWVLVDSDINWTIAEWSDTTERDLPLNFGEHDGTSKYGPYDRDEITNNFNIVLTSLRFSEDKILAEKWRFRHFENFFDNSLGKVNYSEQWISDAPSNFNKTGKYRINYKRRDNPLYPDMSLTNVFDEYRKWSTYYDDK